MSKIKSIGTLLILSVTIIVVLAVAGIVLYVSKSTYNLALHMQEQSLRQAGQAAQQGLDQYIENSMSVLRSLATDQSIPASLHGEPARAQSRIAELVKANPAVWTLLVFDPKGEVVAGANAEGQSLAGQSRADREYYKQIAAGKDTYLANGIIASKSGGGELYVFCVAQAIRDASGRPLGGVAALIRWSAFTDRFINPLRFGERGYGFMIDSKGAIIAHAADKSLMLKNLSEHSFIKNAIEKKNGEEYYDWKGDRKYLSFSTDPETGFGVCMSAFEADLAAPATSQRNMLAGIGVAAVLLLGAGITLITRRLVVAPIRTMQTYAQAVANGQYNSERHAGYRFELASLAANLHHMVDQLKERLGFAQGVLSGFVLPCAVFDRDNKTTFVNTHMLQALEKNGTPESYLG